MGSQNTIIGVYEIDLLKEEYSGTRLMYVDIIGLEFIFRTITFDEFEHMSRVCLDDKELYETACQLTVVYPKEFDFLQGMAGIPEEVGPKIIEVSGFGPNGSEIVMAGYQSYSSLMQTSKYSAMATIKAAMPDVSVDEMEGWSWDKTLKYLALAESTLNILGIKLDMTNEQVNQDQNEEAFDETLAYHLQGIDPILMFGAQIKEPQFLEFPLIGSRHWMREDVVYEVRRQMDNGTRLRP